MSSKDKNAKPPAPKKDGAPKKEGGGAKKDAGAKPAPKKQAVEGKDKKPAAKPAAKPAKPAAKAAAKPAAKPAKPAAKAAAKPAAKPAKPAAKGAAKPAAKGAKAPAKPAAKGAKAPAKPAAKGAKAPAKPAAKGAKAPAKPTGKGAKAPAKPTVKGAKVAAKPAAKGKGAKEPALGREKTAKEKAAARKAAKAPLLLAKGVKVGRYVRGVTPTRKPRPTKLFINCNLPVSHGILDISSFEKYLHDRFKIKKGGKAGVLQDQATITKDKTQIIITVAKPLRKEYLKFLTRNYLKKQQLRDWLRVVSVNPSTYELRYYNIQEAGDESDSEDED